MKKAARNDVELGEGIENVKFTMVPNIVLRDDTLDPISKVIYFLFCSYSFDKKSPSWISYRRISKELHLNQETVGRHVAILEEKHLIERKLTRLLITDDKLYRTVVLTYLSPLTPVYGEVKIQEELIK